MAAKKQVTLRKQELVAQLAGSRHSITRGKTDLKQKLTVKNRVTTFVKKKPKVVFLSALGVGLLGALFLRRRPVIKRPAKTTSQLLLAWGLSLLKPAAKSWAITRGKQLANKQIENKDHPSFTL